MSNEGTSHVFGKDYWGRGIATAALSVFLGQIRERPLYARAAKDNHASLRVLQKSGFTIITEDKGFANARGAEVEEYIVMTPWDCGELRKHGGTGDV